MRYIITYDIEDDKKRNGLAKLLEECGVRLQKSVFECDLSLSKLKLLSREIENIIDTNNDSVIIFPNCKKCLKKRIYIGISYNEKRISIKEI